jgi:hypothetical protein
MLDQDEIRHEEAVRLLSALDQMCFGEWSQRHTGGGCWALACGLEDERFVLVSGDDVLSSFCDPQDFGGSVTVGVYRCEDHIYGGEDPVRLVSVPLAVGDRTVDGIATAVWGVLSPLGVAS